MKLAVRRLVESLNQKLLNKINNLGQISDPLRFKTALTKARNYARAVLKRSGCANIIFLDKMQLVLK